MPEEWATSGAKSSLRVYRLLAPLPPSHLRKSSVSFQNTRTSPSRDRSITAPRMSHLKSLGRHWRRTDLPSPRRRMALLRIQKGPRSTPCMASRNQQEDRRLKLRSAARSSEKSDCNNNIGKEPKCVGEQ